MLKHRLLATSFQTTATAQEALEEGLKRALSHSSARPRECCEAQVVQQAEGDTSKSEGLSTAETARLRQLVLSSGAPRTMAAHISAWERFEDWATAEGLNVFPLTHDKLLKYALALDQKECGPSVLPSFRTSVRWITSKLAIECPDLARPALLAVQAEVTQKRAPTLKEAVPFSTELA